MTIVVLSADKMYVSVYISATGVGVTKTLKKWPFQVVFYSMVYIVFCRWL